VLAAAERRFSIAKNGLHLVVEQRQRARESETSNYGSGNLLILLSLDCVKIGGVAHYH